jgi:uncharacterized membrane protein
MKKNKLKGIGGWLILPTIGLVLGVLLYFLAFLIFVLLLMMEGPTPLALFGTFIGILFTILSSYLLYIEFKERKEFPMYFIGYMWLSIVTLVIFSFLTETNPAEFVVNFIVAIIWTVYFQKSVRVKNTFVK